MTQTADTDVNRLATLTADSPSQQARLPPGIPSDVLDKIFVPFFTTKARGSGLGLPTARRLVEAHRGNIQFACPPGGGTIVTIQLPSERAAAVM